MIKTRRVLTLLAIVLLMTCLSCCAKSHKQDVTLLEFPGIEWNMTPQEVKKH